MTIVTHGTGPIPRKGSPSNEDVKAHRDTAPGDTGRDRVADGTLGRFVTPPPAVGPTVPTVGKSVGLAVATVDLVTVDGATFATDVLEPPGDADGETVPAPPPGVGSDLPDDTAAAGDPLDWPTEGSPACGVERESGSGAGPLEHPLVPISAKTPSTAQRATAELLV